MKEYTMEESALVLLMTALVYTGPTQGAKTFYGASTSFTQFQNLDKTFEANIYHRENGGSSCASPLLSWECVSGACSTLETATVTTDSGTSGTVQWCQAEGHTTAKFQSIRQFSLKASGCCWPSNVAKKTNWTVSAEMDLGIRSDTLAINVPPVTATVSYLRVPQNCFSGVSLLAYDQDSDLVQCSYSGNDIHPNITLNQDKCTLQANGLVQIGTHVFELVLEDFPTKDVTLQYMDGTSVVRTAVKQLPSNNSPSFSKVPLQFTLEILPPIPICMAGHVVPLLLPPTPSQGELHHAAVGQQYQLKLAAQASHSKMYDFQISGPPDMKATYQNGEFGKAEATLSWTPLQSDLQRLVPVCFTAESREGQSEMRCINILVSSALPRKEQAQVSCTGNRMTIILSKDSLTGVDINQLQLIDPSCSLTSNDTYIMGTMSITTCGTILEDTKEYLVFRNEIRSLEFPNEIISRRKRVKIGFSCQYPKYINVHSQYQLQDSDYVYTESSFGSFGYRFDIFKNNAFNETIDPNSYPVEVTLFQMLYFGIEAKSELTNVRLFVESCKATPDDNPENPIFYTLIKNGCLRDETIKVAQTEATVFNFQVQAFKFTGDLNQAYITCSVILCEDGNPFSRCAQGCLNNPVRRRKRGISVETNKHYLTQGPIQVAREELLMVKAIEETKEVEQVFGDPIKTKAGMTSKIRQKGETEEDKPPIITSTIIAAFGVVSIVIVMLFVLALLYIVKRNKANDRKGLLSENSDILGH